MKQLLKIYILDDDPVILGGFTDAPDGVSGKDARSMTSKSPALPAAGSFCSICPTPNLWICC